MAVGKKSTHKNAARSRHLIKQAFAELLNEKDINKITVTDIVDRANISRGTFYAHYLDVYDLYNAIQSNIVETVSDALKKVGVANILLDPTEIIKIGIDFLDKNKAYYKLFLTSSHGETLVRRITTLTEETFKDFILKVFGEDDSKEIICHMYYSTGAIKNMLLQWFYEDIPLTAEECAKYITKFYLHNRPEIIGSKIAEYVESQKNNSNE